MEYVLHVLRLVRVKTLKLLQLAVRLPKPVRNVKISIIAKVGIG